MCGRYYCPDVPLDGAIYPSVLVFPLYYYFAEVPLIFLVDGAEIKTGIGDFLFFCFVFFGVDVKL